MEIWKDIKGYEGLYQVSTFGRVKCLPKDVVSTKYGHKRHYPERIAKTFTRNGYPSVELSKNGKANKFTVHRLVASAFINNSENKPQVNHIDGNKMNNHYSNLEWCTQADNNKHAMKTGLWKNYGVNNHLSKFDGDDLKEIRFLLKKGYTHKEIASRYGVHEATIGKVHRGETYREIGVVN